MKKAVVFFSLTLGILIIGITFSMCRNKDRVQKELIKVAESLTEECPIQHDLYSRLDKCGVLDNHTLKYNYTLLFNANEADTMAFKERIKPSLLYALQTNSSLNYLRDNHISFLYSYKDEQGNNRGNILISPDEYNKPAVKVQRNSILGITDGNLAEALKLLTNEMKKKLPVEFKELNLTITDCKTDAENFFEYTYKLHNESAATFDSIVYKKNMHEGMLESLKSDTNAKELRENGVFMRYICIDKDDKYLCSIVISPEE